MSTSPDLDAEHRLVNVLSRWLARHASDDELRWELDAVGTDGLAPGQAEAVEELRAELRDARSRGDLEMVARETLEALALGG
jgi:hypothetical protein